MADVTIGGIAATLTVLADTDLLEFEQGAASKKGAASAIKDYILSELGDTDVALTADSDLLFATQKATKAYVDAAVGGGVSDGDKGDITVSTDSNGQEWTIDDDAVTYAKMQNVSAAARLLLRGSAGGAGNVEEGTAGGGLSILATVLQAAWVINAQTGTGYAVVASDRGKHVTLSNAASIAATIAQAGTTGFEDGYYALLECIGVGAVTLTPTTSTVNGAATIVLTSGMSALLMSDGANYRAIVFDPAGVNVNAQTGTTYTYLSGDRGKLVTHTNGGAIAGTLPQATGAFGSTWFMWVQNRGVGTLTITPTTSTIDGAATLALTTGQGSLIASDGTNYYTMRGIGGAGGGGLTNFTDGINTSAPNATIPVVSLAATNAATHVDVAIVPKGTSGGFSLAVADNTTTGGNKRGTRAVDLQLTRSAANKVASGTDTFAAGARNTASGDNSVAIGQNNTASSSDCVALGSGNLPSGANAIAIGDTNTVSGAPSWAVGSNATSSAIYAFAQGYYAQATAAYSRATSLCIASGTFGYAQGYAALDRGIYGARAAANGYFAGDGDAQQREFNLRIGTTNATQATVSQNGAAGDTTNQIVLPNNASFVVHGFINVRQNTTGDSASWEFVAHIKRGANAAATAMVAACTPAVIAADAGAAAWAVAVDADTTNGCLRIRVTGEASKTLRWVCRAVSSEVTG